MVITKHKLVPFWCKGILGVQGMGSLSSQWIYDTIDTALVVTQAFLWLFGLNARMEGEQWIRVGGAWASFEGMIGSLWSVALCIEALGSISWCVAHPSHVHVGARQARRPKVVPKPRAPISKELGESSTQVPHGGASPGRSTRLLSRSQHALVCLVWALPFQSVWALHFQSDGLGLDTF